MLGWQVSPTGGQRRFVRADAPDCVASGYWKALSPADRRVVCIKTIRADVILGFLHVSSEVVPVLSKVWKSGKKLRLNWNRGLYMWRTEATSDV
jgi:hypothetical protein